MSEVDVIVLGPGIDSQGLRSNDESTLIDFAVLFIDSLTSGRAVAWMRLGQHFLHIFFCFSRRLFVVKTCRTAVAWRTRGIFRLHLYWPSARIELIQHLQHLCSSSVLVSTHLLLFVVPSSSSVSSMWASCVSHSPATVYHCLFMINIHTITYITTASTYNPRRIYLITYPCVNLSAVYQ